MEIYHVAVNLVSLVINVGLVYFAFKLLSTFKGGIMDESWFFAASGVLALAVSSSIFSLYYTLKIGESWMRGVGGFIMMIGGLLILFGMYKQCKIWCIKDERKKRET